MNGHTRIMGQKNTDNVLIERALEAIHKNKGVMIVDPHGHITDTILTHFPDRTPIIYELSYPIAWNPLKAELDTTYLTNIMVDTFKAMWNYRIPTPDMDLTMYNTLSALIDYPAGTLLGLKFLLTSETFRETVIPHVKNPIVKDYWCDFETLPDKDKRDRTKSTLNKVSLLMADTRIRRSLGQVTSAIDIKDILDKEEVLIVKLPQSELGVQKTSLIGALFLAQFYATSLVVKKPFELFIADIHLFNSPAVLTLLSQRQVALTYTHQYLSQLPTELKDAVDGNTSENIVFRTGLKDSTELERSFPSGNNVPKFHELEDGEARVTADKPTVEKFTFHMEPTGRKEDIEKTNRSRYGSYDVHVDVEQEKFIKAYGAC